MLLPLLLATLAISPTQTPLPRQSPTGDGGSEIQKFREVIQEKVKAKLQEINQVADTDTRRGYLGTITKINSGQINLDTQDKNRLINLATDTIYLNAKSIKIKSTDLKVGQEILAIGLLDDQNNLTAKRIIITIPKSVENLKTVILGQVVDVSTTYSLTSLIPLNNKNTQYQVKTDTKNIQILSKDGAKLTTKDITKGKKIIIVSITPPVSGQSLTAEKIIVL